MTSAAPSEDGMNMNALEAHIGGSSESASAGSRIKLIVAVLGAAIYASAGGLIGSMNAGWLGVETDANGAMPALGVGAGMVVLAFASSPLNKRFMRQGVPAGRRRSYCPLAHRSTSSARS